MNERKTYEIESAMGKVEQVYCTYKEYLFLKMCYGKGLTVEEYKTYKTM